MNRCYLQMDLIWFLLMKIVWFLKRRSTIKFKEYNYSDIDMIAFDYDCEYYDIV